MKRFRHAVLTAVLLLCITAPNMVQAAAGAPGSPDFGYGAWLHLDGNYLQSSLSAMAELQLDWIAIELDWSLYMPDPSTSPDMMAFDQALQSAAANNTAVMISLTNPPQWALTSSGPVADAASQIISSLAMRYPGVVQAVELFPHANTVAGWKAQPDPKAYARLVKDIKKYLNGDGINLTLAAGGLSPAVSTSSDIDMQDLDFLRGLYAAGAAQWMEVISIRFPQITGSPLKTPSGDQTYVLRHYEQVRQVMLENNHTSGLIWITQLSVPDGTIDRRDRVYLEPLRQAEWLQQAAMQIRSQLYIGVFMAQNINPPSPATSHFGRESLILKPDSVHPFYSVLKAIIQQMHPDNPQTDAGRPKGSSLLKCKYKT